MALGLFADNGYAGTSMDDIAKAVGIRKASLYSHFDGKESIFSVLFDQAAEEYLAFVSQLTKNDEGLEPVQYLESIFKTYIRNCRDNPKMYFRIRCFYYPPEFLKDHIMETAQQADDLFLNRIARIFFDGINCGQIRKQQPQRLALSYYYLIAGLSMSARLYGQKELEEEMSDVLDGFFTGLLLV